jgi:hypothetical protein
MTYAKPVIFLLYLTACYNALAERTAGTIIFSEDNQEEVVFDLPVSLLGSLNYVRLQEKVKYYDSFGKKKLLRPEQAKEITFVFLGEDIRMISIPKSGDLSLGSVLSSSENIFLKLEVEGPMRMFYYEYRESTPGMTGSMTTGVSYIEDKFLFQKNGGSIKWPRNLSFRKDMIQYFSDCPELATKIDKKEFGKKDMLEITRFYNSYCR